MYEFEHLVTSKCIYCKKGPRERADNISETLNQMSKITDEFSKYAVLYNAGHTNIDLKMCLVLHAKKLIKLDRDLIRKYISSIKSSEELRQSISNFGNYIGAGLKNTKGLTIDQLRFALGNFVIICMEAIDEGKLKIFSQIEDYTQNENTRHVSVDIVPLTRKI